MSKTPVDDYLAASSQQGMQKNAARDQKQLEMWQTWKADPNPQTLQPLLKQFEPTFNHKVKMWKAPMANEAAFRAELTRHAIKAFENYDPNRGASLMTHVTGRIQKAKRFNTQVQNLARISEDKAGYIGDIDTARDELSEELGREPTHEELGARVGLSPKKVKTIQGQRLADFSSSSFESDPVGHAASRDREIIQLLRPELKPDAQVVYDHLYGFNEKPVVTSTGALAKLLGKSPSQVSRLKNQIHAAYKRHQ